MRSLTLSDIRRFVEIQEARVNAPVDEVAEKKFKIEWMKRYKMVQDGKLDTHPFVGLMANYKG
jgi:hypothetical protein